MWPIGHVAVAYLLYWAYERLAATERADLPTLLVLIFGGLFPDLVDKPLSWYLNVLPTGRTLAHSLLVLVPLCLLVYGLCRHYDRESWGIAFAIGSLSHALVDAAPVLWDPDASAGFLLWPLIPVEPYADSAPTVRALLLDSLTDPYFLLEFVLFGVALLIWASEGYPGYQAAKNRLAKTRM